MRLNYRLLPVVPLLLLWSLDSCQKSSSGLYGNNTPPPSTLPGLSVQLKTDSHFGSVLADGNGKTLYFFSLDASGSSACTGGCISTWPVFYVASPTFGTGLNQADFGVITRSDGAKQTTYKGWPLYYYAGDITAADIKGDGLESIWYVAKPDYTVMLAFSQLVGNDGIQYDSTYKPGTGKTFYMTDDRGVTLYSFSFDKSDTNNYTKPDFSNDAFWPIFQISTIQNTPSTLDKTMFSTINEFGKPQLTYKGWPVYRFGPDSLIRGNSKGISVPTPGIWPVMDEFTAAAP
jgi:predicted lipoprotein with Yx(FWY)xxD motif